MEVQRLSQPSPAPQSALLAEAFSQFISASARLELSYRDLQAEVTELSQALTERNQALSESLSENREMHLALEQVLHSMPCGVLVVSDEGRILLANAEATRLLHLREEFLWSGEPQTLDGVLARTGLDLRSCQTNDPVQDRETAEQELSFKVAADLARPTETHSVVVRRVSLRGGSSFTAGGRPERGASRNWTVLTLRDISARKRMEEERDAARDAVALSQVSALLAHEIRNPLASLELFAGLLADSPDRASEWLSHLRAGIRSLSETVNNVLLMHGGGAPAMERLELRAEAALAVEFLQPLSQQSGVTLQLETDARSEVHGTGATSFWLLGNKSALHQMLLNLCSNALRHTAAGGCVRLRCEASAAKGGRCVRVAVTDTGAGIAQEHLPRLFESGFSGSGSTPGLGLAVCDRLVRQHGGTISVRSRLGEGSTFTLEFPEYVRA